MTEDKRYVSGSISISQIPELIRQHNAERTEDNERGEKKYFLEKMTVFIVAAYTAIAGYQGCQMSKSNAITRDALTSVQRAFVFPSAIATPQLGKDGQSIGAFITVRWENSGTTPTRDLIAHFNHREFDGDMPVNFDFPDLWDNAVEKVNRPFVLAPKAGASDQNGMFLINASEGIGALGKAAIIPLNTKIYLWGWAKYRDVFTETPRHLTEYCYRVSPVSQPPVKNAVEGMASIAFAQCPRHNCQDDECEDYKEQISKN